MFLPYIMLSPLLQRWTFNYGGSAFYELKAHVTSRGILVVFHLIFYLFESPTKINYIYPINFIGKRNVKLRLFQSVKKCCHKTY